MDTQIKPNVEELFEALPTGVKEAIFGANVDTHLEEIGRLNLLHVDQLGALDDLVRLALVGAFPRSAFSGKVERLLEVSKEKAQKITADTNRLIFEPIFSSLKSSEENSSQTEINELDHELERGKVLDEITNPTPTPQRTTTTYEPPTAVSVPAPAVASAPAPVPMVPIVPTPMVKVPDIHEEKLTSSTAVQNTETKIPNVPGAHLVPIEVKEKINRDQYKESI